MIPIPSSSHTHTHTHSHKHKILHYDLPPLVPNPALARELWHQHQEDSLRRWRVWLHEAATPSAGGMGKAHPWILLSANRWQGRDANGPNHSLRIYTWCTNYKTKVMCIYLGWPTCVHFSVVGDVLHDYLSAFAWLPFWAKRELTVSLCLCR